LDFLEICSHIKAFIQFKYFTCFSELSRLHAEQKVIKDDISKLRRELDETKRDLLKAVADSETRTTELLLRVLDEIKSSRD
jgi:hypothetical protein